MVLKKRLAKVEELADKVYGPGSAVSVDPHEDGYRVTVWDSTGTRPRAEQTAKAKENALSLMQRALEADL